MKSDAYHRFKYKYLGLIFFVFCAIHCTKAQQNTILIIADDVSPDYFGFYSKSTDTANSPNIRELLRNGIQFTKAWAAPVCSPTRAGIFTGRYSFRTGVGAVITNAASPQLDTSEISITKLLKLYAPATYNTGSVGKWHLHTATPAKLLFPNKMGYNFYSGNFNGQINNYYNYTRITNGKIDTVKNYATTQTVNDAIGWMDTMNRSKPYFLWLAFNAPHSPFHLPPSNLCNTTGLSGTTTDINTNPKKYFKAAIEAMDSEIGRLIDYLKANNLYANTNIIFIGDNGNATQVAQIANKNKAKGTLYDYGIRVPMIISGPAIVNPNRISDALVSTPDLYSTIAELGGLSNWKNFVKGRSIDSKSLMPILKNQSASVRTWIFSEQFNVPTIANDGKTIRNIDYHLIRFDNGTEEFYNQTVDVEEVNDLLKGVLSDIEKQNYQFLCDSLTKLLGTGTCRSLYVKMEDEKNTIIFYPNPTDNYISIDENRGVKKVRITNFLGEVLYSGHSNKISVSEIPNGLYLIDILLMDNFYIHQKIEIKR